MKRRLVTIIQFVLIALFLAHCAPSRIVKPLAKKEQAVGFSFGGPIIGFAGAYIPIPFTTVSYAKGLTDALTIVGGIHTTSLAFKNFQTDVGLTYGIWHTEKMGLSANIAAQFASGIGKKQSTRCWPSAELNYYYHPNSKNSYVYAGIGAWFELSKTRAHGVAQTTHVLPNIHLGYQIIGKHFSHQIELKYMGLGLPVYPGVVDYKGVNGKGAFGLYYGVIKTF